MKVTVFKRIAKTADGRAFDAFSTKLHRADGTEQYCTVKFRKEVKTPDEYPVIINVSKDAANLARKAVVNEETGETAYRYTLWIEAYTPTGEKFVDHSLDDFVD